MAATSVNVDQLAALVYLLDPSAFADNKADVIARNLIATLDRLTLVDSPLVLALVESDDAKRKVLLDQIAQRAEATIATLVDAKIALIKKAWDVERTTAGGVISALQLEKANTAAFLEGVVLDIADAGDALSATTVDQSKGELSAISAKLGAKIDAMKLPS